MSATVLLSLLLLQNQNDYRTIDYLVPPDGEVLEVGGMGFMSDGDMVVSTRRGQVWRIDRPNADNPNDAIFTLICEGLHEGLGLAVIDDDIYVAQRCELSKLVDLDGDQRIDEIQTITQDWGMSGNYHEFGFGLPVDHMGNMYMSFNLGFWNPHWWHGKSRAPYRGWVMKISPDGSISPYAGGFRSPAGMGLLEGDTLLVTDNQGDWMPVCPIFAVEEGGFYGHPASLRWYDDQPENEPSDTQPPEGIKHQRKHPAIWLPYQWSRSTGNIIQDPTEGPFSGQYFVAELTNGQILRADFEEIDGVLQGACWLAHQRVGSAYHIEFGPNGTLYAGLTNRGWGGLAPGSGIARIKPTGTLSLEMKTAHLLDDGFELTFTKPLARAPTVVGDTYDYNWWWEYGSPLQNVEELQIRGVSLSQDGLTATVSIDNLEAGKCVMLKLQDVISVDGTELLFTEMSYTINKMPQGELVYVAKQAEPPVERGDRVEGWLYLTWADVFDMWNNEGVVVCNAELDLNNPTKLAVTDGPNALVARKGNAMSTKFVVDRGTVKMKYMLAEEAKAEVRLPNGGAVILSNEDGGGYLGAGIWHDLLIEFQSDPRIINFVEINGVRTESDVAVVDRIASPTNLLIRGLHGEFAFGDVRLKHMPSEIEDTEWMPLDYNERDFSTSGNATWNISDSGELELQGDGSTIIPLKSNISAIRFDAKINGEGIAILRIGELEVDIAAWGYRKTGGITGHPIRANLIDIGEWCTVEIMQEDNTTVLLNGVPIIIADDAPSLHGDAIQITTDQSPLHLRRTYIR